jgi:cysteine synthase A
VQGWAPDFIPMLTQEAVELGLVDQVIPVNGAGSMELSRKLAQQEGIFTGISGGATLAGALEVCKSAPEGSTVLCMLPDTGERYLTTPLFEDIAVEMTEEEREISRSTPNYRFDEPSPALAVPEPEAPAGSAAEAEEILEAALTDAEHPVVMFALEWCEFCWSVRKMFTRAGIPYRSVDLDSVQYQKDDLGGRIRAALAARTSLNTIPQIFVGGELIGGCNEIFAAYKDGKLQRMLREKGVTFDESVQLDPDKLLPGWLHPR